MATALGPVLVTPHELADCERDGHYDLAMEVCVNDTRTGGDTLANMAWTFADLIAYASRGTWVRPGDVLSFGHLRRWVSGRAVGLARRTTASALAGR